MVQKDAESLWRDALEGKARGEGELKCDDKFLVQTTVVSAALFKAELADKDDKTISAPLQKLWKTLADEDKKSENKKSIKSNKLMTTFTFPEDMNNQVLAISSSTPSSSSSSSSNNNNNAGVVIATSTTSNNVASFAASPIKSSPHGSAEAVFAELSALRKKYDDLVAYTVVLTGERDFLQQVC
jgi:hypothetical protein